MTETAGERQKVERHIGDLVHCIAGPLIVFSTPWSDVIPKWVRGEITMRRMIQQMKMLRNRDEPKLATDIETMAYIMPRTMDAPMDHDWTEIYLWLARKCLIDAGRPGVEATEDIAPKEINQQQKEMLRHLQRWLWDRYENVKKGYRRQAKDRHSADLVIDEYSQLTLFKEVPDEGRRGPQNGKDERGAVALPRGDEVQETRP
jgi:hypothetical protein